MMGIRALVAWTPVGEIILPKRYYTFKHFSNLVKKDYRVIKNNSQALQNNIYVGAFIAPDESKLVFKFLIKVLIQSFLLIFQKSYIDDPYSY
ncbi:MAG: hypothetical protein CM15mP121_1870 [Bacteroidota bacterium]|nr:MAG: hypothetical protein CM15mP121_1870 [Bacteroidota bacterium]